MQNKIAWVIPTRNRSEAVEETLQAAHSHAGGYSDFFVIPDGDRASFWSGLVPTLNRVATGVQGLYTHIGFMGDDHRVRTLHYDVKLIEAAGWAGIAFGDDLFQGPKLPTAVVMSSNIVRLLGFMAPPVLRHNYIDNFWLDLGTALDRITYVPEVVIEHLHSQAGKAKTDESYEVSSQHNVRLADAFMYEEWKKTELDKAVALLSTTLRLDRDLDAV